MKKKILLITLVILLIVSMLTSIVSAASFIASMTASATTVPETTEFTVTIKVSNIDAGANGINTVEGILSYDTAVFEALTTSSIDPLGEWSVTYTPDTGKLVLYKNSWANEDQDIAQVTLKTKKGTSGKSGYIRYTDIMASNSESEIEASDISTIITVGNATSSGNTGNTSANTNTPQQIPMNSSKNTNTNTNKNTNTANNTNKAQSSYVDSNKTNGTSNTVSEEDIPYTGTSDNIMRAIFVVLVIAGVSYFKYESIKEN